MKILIAFSDYNHQNGWKSKRKKKGPLFIYTQHSDIIVSVQYVSFFIASKYFLSGLLDLSGFRFSLRLFVDDGAKKLSTISNQ